jgi:carboxylesterase type B
MHVSTTLQPTLVVFLSTQDDVIPGNNGLKDELIAIQWTHNNIHLFGGNSNQITIFGGSAGSASCAYQQLSQNSEGSTFKNRTYHGSMF